MKKVLARMNQLLIVALIVPAVALAQAYPTKPIRVVVPFGTGGVADITTRVLAPKLSEGLGQQVIVENKPSAGGIIAAEQVARAEPDGYTLLLITNGAATATALYKSLPFDPVNDFAMISTVGFFGLAVVTDPKSPVKTVKDVIALAKASPGKYNIGSISVGSTQYLAAALFRYSADLDMQLIPYKATPEVFIGLKNQDLQIAFEILAPLMANIRSGNLRAVAVTGAKRYPGLPDVPTVKESGVPGYDVSSWNGLAAPAKTPRAVIERLNRETVKALASPEIKKRFADVGVEARSSSPAELHAFFISESRRWSKVVEAAKIPKQ
jgi:tripartite-type tricarboxylate transporter receptor subunit TctC